MIKYLDNAEGSYNVNAMGILFASELLKKPALLQQLADIQAEGKQYLCEQLEQNRYDYIGQYGNYVLIRTNKNPNEVAQMMREKKILIKTYNNSLLKDWVRVTTGSKKIMQQFWNVFIQVETV